MTPWRSCRGARAVSPLVGALVGCAVLLGTLAPIASAAGSDTCPNEAIREQQTVTEYLPECRAFERVSPAAKNGQELGPINSLVADEVSYQAATRGSAAFYTMEGGIPGSESGALYPPVLSRSQSPADPWQAFPQSPSTEFSAFRTGAQRNGAPFGYLNPSLNCGVYASELAQPEHPGVPGEAPELPANETADEQVQNLYVKDFTQETNTLVTSVRPQEPALSAGAYVVAGATADCKHVIFENLDRGYALPVTPKSTQYAPRNSLYEWSRGSEGPRVASVLPDGVPAGSVVVGGAFSAYGSPPLNQISSDGRRAFFTAQAEGTEEEGVQSGTPQVYMRVDGNKTLTISASTTCAPKEPCSTLDRGALFEGASSDGTRAFFLANYGLAASSSAGGEAQTTCNTSATDGKYGEGCDLYEFRLADATGGKGTLTDLSADVEAQTGDTKGANVRGVVGISDDGSSVYFSASGQLVPGKGNTEIQNETPYPHLDEELRLDEANVYNSREAEAPRYVASIRRAEAGAGAPTEALDAILAAGGHGMQYLVSRVSSDGEYLLLASDRSLTGYNNLDVKTGKPDPELFEYRQSTESLTCVSCDPAGQPPDQPSAQSPFSNGGPFLEVHTSSIPRNLLDDGRVFFDSATPLTATAEREAVNAYVWAPPGLQGCASGGGCVAILDTTVGRFDTYFVGASEDGENAYISTAAQLAPEDGDGSRDLYDVRVDGGKQYVPPTPGCEEDGLPCQPGGGTVPLGDPRASESGIASGNPLPVPAPQRGVEGFAAATVTVAGHSTRGTTLTVRLKAPGAGTLRVSGPGLKTLTRSITKPGGYTLKLSLSTRAAAALRHHKRLKVKVQVRFSPTGGPTSSTSFIVRFH